MENKLGLLTKQPLTSNTNITTEQHRLMDAIDRMSITAETGSTTEVRRHAARAAALFGETLRNL